MLSMRGFLHLNGTTSLGSKWTVSPHPGHLTLLPLNEMGRCPQKKQGTSALNVVLGMPVSSGSIIRLLLVLLEAILHVLRLEW